MGVSCLRSKSAISVRFSFVGVFAWVDVFGAFLRDLVRCAWCRVCGWRCRLVEKVLPAGLGCPRG